ncbi:phage tail protein [Burkholderia anthina]|uniref:phage tail protein n=1 Tax=Burkholderia anthina TaxID=179879 RepID=UPI001FB79AE9|nr:phage tail protein [Burkholderia anthina]
MQSSQSPTLVPLAFAANGTKRTIPEASQIGITAGAASLNDGFPPLTFTPIAAGGVPPAGADFNGILNLITQSLRWQHAGGQYSYNSAFANDTNVGGYPRGAVLMRADNSGMWLNQTDNNTANPDTGGAGWVAAFMSGTVGQVRNLVMSVATAATTATLTADEIVVGSALGGQKYVIGAFSKTINLATTGAGGMDGSYSVTSGFVAIYAIYNPTTGASALLATNATSNVVPNVYGGSGMPSGYTASALVSVWPTNGSSQFVVGYQSDRSFSTTYSSIASTSSQIASLMALSVSSFIPKNAKSITGFMNVSGNNATNTQVNIASSSAGINQQQCVSSSSSAGTLIGSATFGKVPIINPQTIYWNANCATGTFVAAAVFASGYDI